MFGTIQKGWLRYGLVAVAFTATGCAHVGRDDFDAEMASIRQEIQAGDEGVEARLGARLDETESRIAELEGRLNSVESGLRSLEEQFDVTVERMEMALRFNTPIHFGFDDDEISIDQEPLLQRFSAVVQEHYPGALVTVEGFTDPSGPAAYNLKLGQRRADSVREWLVASGGMMADNVKAISYGEDTSRLVRDGEQGPGATGRENRRVVFVIEHAPEMTRLRAVASNGG